MHFPRRLIASLAAALVCAAMIQPLQADSPPANDSPYTFPPAIARLKGRTVRILLDLDIHQDGKPSAQQTHFIAELLKLAGAKVITVNVLNVKHEAGELFIMGEAEVNESFDRDNPIDAFRHDRSEQLARDYDKVRKQLAEEAKKAGAEVIGRADLVAYLGLNKETEKEYARYVDDAARTKLDLALPDVKFENVGLSDVIDFFRDVTGASIFVNWQDLETRGIRKDTPVTVRMRNVKFSKALQVTLDTATGAKEKIGFEMDAGIINIPILNDGYQHTVSHTYDIRFLLPDSLPAAARAQRSAAIVKLITGTIDPISWNSHAGKSCTLAEKNGELVVQQTEGNHKAIENLITHMRELLP